MELGHEDVSLLISEGVTKMLFFVLSGRIPGLRWLDEEKSIFRVPWIHAKKRDYIQERDAALFREWAIHSGEREGEGEGGGRGT